MSRPIRPITSNGDGTASVHLTRGYTALIDIDDVGLVSEFNWFVIQHPNHTYAGRAGSRPGRRNILMHRVILNASDGMYVDHVDGNGLNNTRANIRLCTHQQNMLNKSIYSNSPTGFRGVYPVPGGRYIARIRVDGRWINLGTFDTPEEAAIVRDQASLTYYGDFAQLNILERKVS